MKRVVLLTILCVVFACPTIVGWAIDPGEVGVNYNCAFPNSVKVDGNLKDLSWQFAPWHEVPHDKGTAPAPSDKDASYSFAVVADDKWLYVAFKVKDDKIQKDGDVGCDVWKDDSVEIYIDAGHEQAGSYDKNDAQITIGADNIGGDINKPKLGGCVGITQGPTTGTIAAVVTTSDGWAVEAAVPLKNAGWDIKPKDGLVIGFNTHFNDDDDGGARDHKLIWSDKDVADRSWTDPSVYAELTFVEEKLAVSQKNKLATSWGWIKSSMKKEPGKETYERSRSFEKNQSSLYH
ncbi:TPA: hypothetical protein EYP66_02935 [Candidatus Poribacteria bacterium]|nr:hypothetical protein [Candidatus Poribacteria bacterium]